MDREFLKKTVIFKGMTDDEIDTALTALLAREKAYEKDEYIFLAGDVTDDMGLILSGSIRIESNDMWGNSTILSHVGKGQFFAETYALMKDEPLSDVPGAARSCSILDLVQKLHFYKNARCK